MGKNQLSEGGKVIVGLKRVFVILARDTKVRSHIMRFISEENGGARGPGSIVDTSDIRIRPKTGENGQKWSPLGVMNPKIFLNLQAPRDS